MAIEQITLSVPGTLPERPRTSEDAVSDVARREKIARASEIEKAYLKAVQARDGYAFTGFLPNQIKYLDLIKAGHDVPGRKIMSFIKALEGDNYAVVVDIWMTRAFGTARLRQYDNRKTTLAPTKREYDAIEAYCRLEAIIRGVTPREYQSIIWTGIKRAESPLSRETCWSDLIMKRRGFVSF